MEKRESTPKEGAMVTKEGGEREMKFAFHFGPLDEPPMHPPHILALGWPLWPIFHLSLAPVLAIMT